MINLNRIYLVSAVCLVLILVNSCQKEDDNIKIKKNKLSGYVQKGPYINGTSIQMYELNSSLNQTGKVFSTQIINNRGSFEISEVQLSSEFVEFSASGYYFNEITGDISPSELSLYALSDITDLTTVNVNILTHLEKGRVDYLVDYGKSFSEAKDTAQKEVLAIFGYELPEMDNSEMLDIAVNKDENAILLAISLILQGNRSVGDLTELLANITTDMKQDGKLNGATILSQLRSTTLLLDLAEIRSNLETRYEELGINATIPGFEEYINDFLSFTGLKPTTSTQAASVITTTGAILNGTVNANDLSTTVTFEYGTTTDYGSTATATQNPVSGHDNTAVSAAISDLSPGTTYHFRVKSVNSLGTVYGSDYVFITFNITDIDGNGYHTITIGSQIWMKENLKTSKYNDGNSIPNITDNSAWLNLTSPGYCWVGNDILNNKNIYGALYNRYAIELVYNGDKKICPNGWHIPIPSDWQELINFLGGSSIAGGKLKEEGLEHWDSPNIGAENSVGFSAIPAGRRGTDGNFIEFGFKAVFYVSHDFQIIVLYSNSGSLIVESATPDKRTGTSIRCIKD